MTNSIILILGGFIGGLSVQNLQGKNKIVGYALASLSIFLVLHGLRII